MKRYYIIFLLLLVFSFNSVADETFSDYLQSNNFEKIRSTFNNASKNEQEEFKQLIFVRIRELVSKDNLEDALELSHIVLLQDLEDKNAQDLFASINSALKRKKGIKEEHQRKANIKDKKQLEQNIQTTKILKEKNQLKKEQETINKKEKRRAKLKETYTSNLGNYKLSGFFGITPMELELAQSKIVDKFYGTKTLNTRGGIGFQLQGNIGNMFVRGSLNIGGDFLFLKKQKSDLKILFPMRTSIASPFYTGPFALGLGFRYYKLKPGRSIIFHSLASPTIGLGVDQWRILNNLDLTAFIDFNIAPAWINLLQFGMIIGSKVRYHFADFYKKMGWYVQQDISFDSLFIEGKSEYSILISFSIGVSYNE